MKVFHAARNARASWAFLAVGLIVLGTYPLVPHGGVTYDVWYQIFGIAGTAAILVGVWRRAPHARAGWIAIALGQFGFVLGDAGAHPRDHGNRADG